MIRSIFSFTSYLMPFTHMTYHRELDVSQVGLHRGSTFLKGTQIDRTTLLYDQSTIFNLSKRVTKNFGRILPFFDEFVRWGPRHGLQNLKEKCSLRPVSQFPIPVCCSQIGHAFQQFIILAFSWVGPLTGPTACKAWMALLFQFTGIFLVNVCYHSDWWTFFHLVLPTANTFFYHPEAIDLVDVDCLISKNLLLLWFRANQTSGPNHRMVCNLFIWCSQRAALMQGGLPKKQEISRCIFCIIL